MQPHKSLHTIFYTLSYDSYKPNNSDDIIYIEEDDDIRYFTQFNSLFKKGKIATYEVLKLKSSNGKINTCDSVLKLLIGNEKHILPIERIKYYIVEEFNAVIISVTVANYIIDDFVMLSRHLDKNSCFGSSDEFIGITINDYYIANHIKGEKYANTLINEFFFDGSAKELRLVLGRKNFHLFSIVDDTLSLKCKDISNDNDYSLYKIATSEFVNTTVGKKTYAEFIDSIYDKWQDTGSLYFVNFTNFVQILPSSGVDHSINFIESNEKMVVLSLFQKAMFVNFQTIEQKRNDLKSFNSFINQYYYLEISPERQLDTLYAMLQKGLKNLEYYEILTSEIEIYSASLNNRTMFIVTLTYTFFALISVFLMLKGR